MSKLKIAGRGSIPFRRTNKMKKIKNLFKKPLSFIKDHKIISAVLIIVIVVIGFVIKPKPAAVLETQTIKYSDIIQSVSVTGSVDSTSSASLTFQTLGQLTYVGARVGESVYKGQIIASIDSTKLQANLRQAWQDFNAAKAVVEQVYDQTKRATDLTFAQKVTQTAAEATQNNAYDDYIIARKQLADSSLVSPLNGSIIRADAIIPGADVSTTTTYQVADSKNLLFKMDVDEADVSKIKIGQQVRIVLDSFPNDTITLTVSSIDFSSHTTSTGGNAYTIKTDLLDNADKLYRIGMNADAEIILAEKKNILTVSNFAIDGNSVYVKTSSGIVKKTVKLGFKNDSDSQIVSGLSEGDIVILQPSQLPKK